MIKFYCDECEKPLEDKPSIGIQAMMFAEPGKPPRAIHSAHFCDPKCFHSFTVKAFNRPVIVTPQTQIEP